MDELDKELFDLFNKFYLKKNIFGVPKDPENKLSRDYKHTGFPAHVLKTIRAIGRSYDCIICVLRGGLPYTMIFELYGYKNVRYVWCSGSGASGSLGYKEVGPSLKCIKNKRILIVDNNAFTGNTPLRVFNELKQRYDFKSADLFLDYIVPASPLMLNGSPLRQFSKVIIARKTPVLIGKDSLKKDFLARLKRFMGVR
jgi:hypothetical protein